MVSVQRRVTRAANEPTAVVWPTGEIAGRSEVVIATCVSPDGPRWWRVVLDALTGPFDGGETGAAQSAMIQSADTWCRIKAGDGVASPIYISWPAVGGVMYCYGGEVSVSALPLVSALLVANPGPTWGVAIDGEPLDTGDRTSWLGLGVGPLAGYVVPGSSVSPLIAVPPYARAAVVTSSTFNAQASLTMFSSVAGVGSFTLGSVFGVSLPTRQQLDPRCARLQISNTGVPSATFFVYFEVAP